MSTLTLVLALLGTIALASAELVAIIYLAITRRECETSLCHHTGPNHTGPNCGYRKVTTR